MGELQLRGRVQEPRPGGGEEGSRGADDRLAGLVAGGLRPLRPAVHSHGVAQRRHLPHRRRPRRRRPGPAALRAAQQLAGQRQPRQGAPAAVADQAEVWPQDFLGRPDDPHRQRRAGNDGLQDVRFRRRSRGRLGAGSGRLLGPRPGWAATSATSTVPRASTGAGARVRRRRGWDITAATGESAGRGADGPDLRQPRRSGRQSRSARGGHGHPRDLRPHGDERRGNRRADRRRPHLRQDPRRRPCVARGA